MREKARERRETETLKLQTRLRVRCPLSRRSLGVRLSAHARTQCRQLIDGPISIRHASTTDEGALLQDNTARTASPRHVVRIR